MTAPAFIDQNGVVSAARTFKCGQPRTPENTLSNGKAGAGRCKHCRQLYLKGVYRSGPLVLKGDGVSTWRICGHARTPENTWRIGKGRTCCAKCQKERNDKCRAKKRGELFPLRRRRRVKLDLSADSDVQQYRLEKERRRTETSAEPIAQPRKSGRSIPRYWQGAA